MGNLEEMEERESIADVINDLIKINNDRIEGYEKAITEIKDEQEQPLKALFSGMISESQQFKTNLESIVIANGGEVAKGALLTGKLYRTWMGVKALLTAGGKRTILSSCETGERAVQQAYDQALNHKDLPENVQSLIKEQKSVLEASLETISKLRKVAVEATSYNKS